MPQPTTFFVLLVWKFSMKKDQILKYTIFQLYKNISLTHYSPVLLFYTPWKYQKTERFSDVFRGYRKATPSCNGLNQVLKFTEGFLTDRFYVTKSIKSARHSAIFKSQNEFKLTIELPWEQLAHRTTWQQVV